MPPARNAILILALLALAACHHSIAGFYLANLPTGVVVLEIDTGAGNTIAGRLRLDATDASGTLVERDLPLSGTVMGNQIAMLMGQPDPFAAPARLFGHHVGDALVLDGINPNGSTTHIFGRLCTQAAAQDALNIVKTRAAISRAAALRQAADRVVQQATLEANAYADAADATAARIASVAALAPQLTARMREAAATPRSGALLALAQQSAIFDSQLRFALLQAADTAAALQNRTAAAAAVCRAPPQGGPPSTLKADCMTLASMAPGLRAATATVAQAFAAAELAWQQASADQARVLQEARSK